MKDTLPKYEAHNDGLRKDMNTVMNNLDVERDRGEVVRNISFPTSTSSNLPFSYEDSCATRTGKFRI